MHPSTSMNQPPPVAVAPAAAARYWAARSAGAAPHTWLGELGITLRVCRAVLEGRHRRIWGAWDPLLRRIELYGCEGVRSNAALVTTLGHELAHALAENPCDEGAADEFAAAWCAALGAARVARCAAALRACASNAETDVPESVTGTWL
ncbi:MAG: hypothetical protein IPM18_06325 [Phycisphaerales bacterium]|nr:hypothetical protein [Phycisphaerales bacterium]